MRSGLTLIELTIVLFILGLLTHFAVIEASRVREEALVKAASRQFDEISSAVLDWSSGEPSGFLLDMDDARSSNTIVIGKSINNSLSTLG